jgi:hypothetical protein
MLAILQSLGMFINDLFKSPRRLQAESLFLRHQLSVALRCAPPRLRLRGCDRALLVLMTRLWPSLLGATQIVQPETILRWHRAGFRSGSKFTPARRPSRSSLRQILKASQKSVDVSRFSTFHGHLFSGAMGKAARRAAKSDR